jgi:hypothetical protein
MNNHTIASFPADLEDHGISLKPPAQMLKQIPHRAPGRHDISLRCSALLFSRRFPGVVKHCISTGDWASVHGRRSKFFRWTGAAQANSNNIYYDNRYFCRRFEEKLVSLGARSKKS